MTRNRHKATGRRGGELEVAMTPMIDVVFMLLIFFVWTASLQVSELMLPSSLLTREGQGTSEMDPELIDLERIVVRMGWDGERPNWTVNEVLAVDLTAVRQRLQTVAAIRADLPVLVDPVPAVPMGHVIDVYDAARTAGFEAVQFATPVE